VGRTAIGQAFHAAGVLYGNRTSVRRLSVSAGKSTAARADDGQGGLKTCARKKETKSFISVRKRSAALLSAAAARWKRAFCKSPDRTIL
jgi:hypothetical protein